MTKYSDLSFTEKESIDNVLCKLYDAIDVIKVFNDKYLSDETYINIDLFLDNLNDVIINDYHLHSGYRKIVKKLYRKGITTADENHTLSRLFYHRCNNFLEQRILDVLNGYFNNNDKYANSINKYIDAGDYKTAINSLMKSINGIDNEIKKIKCYTELVIIKDQFKKNKILVLLSREQLDKALTAMYNVNEDCLMDIEKMQYWHMKRCIECELNERKGLE